MPLEIFEVHFDCAGSQNLVGRGECLSRLRSRCGAARVFGHDGHFSWQAQGKPRLLVVQGRLVVTGDTCQGSEWLDFDVEISGRCSTWDLGRALNIVTGAANRDFSTCGSFSEIVAGAALCEP